MSANTFLPRLPDSAIEERQIVSTAFKIVDTMRTKAAAIRANEHLTAFGQNEQIKITAKGGLRDQFRQEKARANKMAADLANLRSELKLKPIDKTNVFEELQRQEIRTWLRSLPENQRIRAALEADPQATEAIVHASPALSGLSPEIHARVAEAMVQRVHGAQIEGIERREVVVQTAAAALQAAESQFRSEAGLTEKEFNE